MTADERFREIVREIVREELGLTGRDAKPSNATDHLTVAEYARRFSISQSTVRDAIRDKRLPSIRIGRAVRIPANAQIVDRAPDRATERARLRLLGGGTVK